MNTDTLNSDGSLLGAPQNSFQKLYSVIVGPKLTTDRPLRLLLTALSEKDAQMQVVAWCAGQHKHAHRCMEPGRPRFVCQTPDTIFVDNS